MTKNELTKIDPVAALRPLILATQKGLAAIAEADGMMRSLAVAHAIIDMRNAVSDETKVVLRELANDPCGFRTDETPNGRRYTPDEVTAVCLHGLMKGAQLVDDEFQIIKSRLYLGQNYFVRMLNERPGVSNVSILPTRPEVCGKAGKETLYTVGGSASCKVDGTPVVVILENRDGADTRVVVSAYDSTDAAAGKAKKRLAQLLYEMVTGTIVSDEPDEGDPIVPGLSDGTRPLGYLPELGDPHPNVIGEADRKLTEPEIATTNDGEPDWEAEFRDAVEPAREYYEQFKAATSAAELRDVWKSVTNDQKEKRLGSRDVNALRLYSTWRFNRSFVAPEGV